jgi:hypothetical protein
VILHGEMDALENAGCQPAFVYSEAVSPIIRKLLFR